MTDTPWQGDATSLVEAFRSGERSPVEEMQATLTAIEASDLNCFSFVDQERALQAAKDADVSLPFGGIPMGIKELDSVQGWPDTKASLVFKDRIATKSSTTVDRIQTRGGAALVGLTNASEFGGLNVGITKLNGVTHNPWMHGKTVGGSSGGSGAAVAGGLVTLASAADGGGSIRIPAGYNGLVGFKGTYGRIPRGPEAHSRPSTEVPGCLSRSVRDIARYFDVCAGVDLRDPWSLPSEGTWESLLGSTKLKGLKVGVIASLGGVTLDHGVEELILQRSKELIEALGWEQVEINLPLPNMTAEWMMGNVSTLLAELGDLWPGCAGDLTPAIEDGLRLGQSFYNLRTAAIAEAKRLELNAAFASAFEKVDLILTATNPGPAFAADSQMSGSPAPIIDKVLSHPVGRAATRAALAVMRTAGGVVPNTPSAVLGLASTRIPEILEMGGLTIPANIYGNPAVSLPAGLLGGLPVGLQVMAANHQDALLLDVALAAERTFEWPLAAPKR